MFVVTRVLSSCSASTSCPPAPVGVVALLALLATTVQRAPGGVEPARSSVQQPACAARPGLEFGGEGEFRAGRNCGATRPDPSPFLRPGAARKQPTPSFLPVPAAAWL